MEPKTLTQVTCFHCGDACAEEHRVHDGKDFCCHGCEVVYDLLNEAGLCEYYALEKQPGMKHEVSADEHRLELFELPEIRERVVEFAEGGITRVRFRIPQMHCSSCIWLLENLDRVEPAVIRSRVSFTDKELTITFREEQLPLQGLVKLLRRIGYGPQLTAADGRERTDRVPRMLYIRLGVAGFIFGNTMLFSFPEYLGADGEANLREGFQWLSALFSVPVVFFLSTDYFRAAWAGIRSKQINIDQPIALGIVALWLRSLHDVVSGMGPGYFDSLAGLLFFLLVGKWYQAHTYRALRFDRALEDFLPLIVMRKRGDAEETARVADLKPGDRILIRDQELVPVDAILRVGDAHIDNSFITGEPLPVRKYAGDTIKAGGRQRGGLIELEVLRSFGDSRLKQLWAEQAQGGSRPAMPRMIDQVARRFTLAVLLIALGAGLYWWGKDPAQVWPIVTAVLIVACPCALALSMPFAYGHTIRLLGKRGLFLRDAEVVERMAHVDAVLFDKTGTLTEREAHQVDWHGIKLSQEDEQRIAALARNSAHPLSAVLAGKLKKALKPDQDRFDPLGMTEVLEQIGQGIMGDLDGLPIRIGSADFTGGGEAVRAAGEAHVHVSIGGVHRGHFAIRKQARSGIVEAVRRLGASLRVGLITGDHQVDPDLARVFPIGSIRMRCAPDEKSEAVKGLQRDGRRVLMVGDGLNDAGALAQADVGVTVTETTAALTPASDAIMDADSLQQLPHFLRMTRRARRIVLASLCISLLYNITGVSIAVAGHMTPLFAAILMPLSSVSVVGFVTVATMIAARNARQ